MNGLIERIGAQRFFRIHRSRIVNITRVKELLIAGGGDYHVVLWDGTQLGLSRLYRDALQEQLTGPLGADRAEARLVHANRQNSINIPATGSNGNIVSVGSNTRRVLRFTPALLGRHVVAVGRVDHLDEQRQPALAIGERAIGAQIEPRVRRQAQTVALRAQHVAGGVARRCSRESESSIRSACAPRGWCGRTIGRPRRCSRCGADRSRRRSARSAVRRHGVLELGLVPRVRQPAVEAVRRSPFELELDAVRRRRSARSASSDAAAGPRGCSRCESPHLRSAADRCRDGGRPIPTRASAVPIRCSRPAFDASPTVRAPAACRQARTAPDRSSAPGAGRRRRTARAARSELRTRSSSHGDALLCSIRSQRSTRTPGVIEKRAVGVHRYCAQPAADQASTSAFDEQWSSVVWREAAIDARRIQRLRLRAELDEVRRSPDCHSAPPRQVTSRSLPSSRTRPSTTRLP